MSGVVSHLGFCWHPIRGSSTFEAHCGWQHRVSSTTSCFHRFNQPQTTLARQSMTRDHFPNYPTSTPFHPTIPNCTRPFARQPFTQPLQDLSMWCGSIKRQYLTFHNFALAARAAVMEQLGFVSVAFIFKEFQLAWCISWRHCTNACKPQSHVSNGPWKYMYLGQRGRKLRVTSYACGLI